MRAAGGGRALALPLLRILYQIRAKTKTHARRQDSARPGAQRQQAQRAVVRRAPSVHVAARQRLQRDEVDAPRAVHVERQDRRGLVRLAVVPQRGRRRHEHRRLLRGRRRARQARRQVDRGVARAEGLHRVLGRRRRVRVPQAGLLVRERGGRGVCDLGAPCVVRCRLRQDGVVRRVEPHRRVRRLELVGEHHRVGAGQSGSKLRLLLLRTYCE
ncbi:hypothetical protein OH76DRAFT_849867 [Lentinus brumalis]|uniref:Uncharacterized protein n=1 Tax=Lentinus brumalis TaxID=2498619 RepID=A0A371DQX3_9APHY|nr:hypothetical protein OH76DRAFT_849867 [Polyporus brumalis]